jgi:hypothetical protein
MGERGEWDAFEVLGAYGGEELLPACSHYE